ncbi:RodZ domain-containing protein [Halothiobacillus sp. 15-55-196]|uniref:RodZ domain-containing protein n=1 Tax=Halothiobacillus sp. 15-55-196 TaxID=1970382 RepID=UPI0025BD7FC7|nr:RodZ domain-containing protein [Halothiobacillus sp. 15-55-196]
MSEGPMKNHEPNLPPLGLKQHAGEEMVPEETKALDISNRKSLGALIQEARAAKGLSAADLAQSLNLDLRIVERLEADQFEGAPEPIYVRAYLKHWAGLVGADPQVWLQAYQLQHGGNVAPNKIGVTAPIEVMTAHKTSHAVHSTNQNNTGRTILRGLLTLVVLVIILAVIAIALPGLWQKGFSLVSGKQEQKPLALNGEASGSTVSLPVQPLPALNTPAVTTKKAPEMAPETTTTNVVPPPPPMTTPSASPVTPDAASTAPGGTPTPMTSSGTKPTTPDAAPAASSTPAPADVTPTEQTTPAATPSANLVIKVDSADCWVEVRDAAGKRLVYDVLKKGEERTVPGAGPFTITLGNPSAVTVLWKGEPVKLGTPNSTTGVIRTTVGGS